MKNGPIQIALTQITSDEYGTIRYLRDGILHRDDGPAIIKADGAKAWLINGNLNRSDGPAYEDPDGYQEFWVDDVRYHPSSDGRPDLQREMYRYP